MLSRYRTLLSRPGVSVLLATSVLARMPLGMSALAILLLVRGRTGSFLAAGLAVGAFTAAGAAGAPVQGRLLDRLGQVRVLRACAIGEAGMLLALVGAARAGASAGVLVALAAPAGALMPPVSAGLRALWPMLAPEAAVRETAYALDAATQEIIWTAGPLIVALAVAAGSPSVAVVVCAGVTLAGTLAFTAVPLVRRWRSGRAEHGRVRALADPGLRVLLGMVVLLGMAIGTIEVGLPALATHLGRPASAGVLLAGCSLGSMLGGVLAGAHRWSVPPALRHQILLGWLAVLLAPLLLAYSLAGAIVLSVIAGMAIAPVLSCEYSLVGSLASPGALAEAFMWHTSALVAGVSAGSALTGALVDGLGVRAAPALGCACALAAFGLAWIARGRFRFAGIYRY